MVFDAGNVVLRRPTRIRIDPFVDAELRFRFLQVLCLDVFPRRDGAARHHVGLGFDERGERTVRLSLARLPVEPVGSLHYAVLETVLEWRFALAVFGRRTL